MFGILTVVLLLPYPLGADLGGIADPQLVVQLCQQSFEPTRMPRRLHPDPYPASV